MTLLIIIIIVVAALVVVGATQRKNLKLWFRSETSELVESKMDKVKVIKLQIKDAQVEAKAMIEQAGVLYAEEEKQQTKLEKIKTQIANVLAEAKKAKADDNEALAMSKLTLKRTLEEQKDLIEANINGLSSQKTSLEISIAQLGTRIQTFKIKMEAVKARQDTNNALKAVSKTVLNGNTVEEVLEVVEEEVKFESDKLEYMTNGDPKDAQTAYGEEVKKDFDNL